MASLIISQSPNRNGSTSSSPTKHRYSSKDSGNCKIEDSHSQNQNLSLLFASILLFVTRARPVSSIAETNATQGPSYIPFSQRQSKSDVAAAAALKALKSKKKVPLRPCMHAKSPSRDSLLVTPTLCSSGQDSSEFAADSSVSKSEVVQRSVTFAGSSTQRSRDLQAMAAIANSSSSSSAGPARHSPAEGKAEKALREAMKDYERCVSPDWVSLSFSHYLLYVLLFL
jgi:hypothetical protein